MKAVYKYTVPIRDAVNIRMPAGAVPLFVGQQSDRRNLKIWALVDITAPMVEYVISIYGTGHQILLHEHDQFIGTVIDDQHMLVWHVWQRRNLA